MREYAVFYPGVEETLYLDESLSADDPIEAATMAVQKKIRREEIGEPCVVSLVVVELKHGGSVGVEVEVAVAQVSRVVVFGAKEVS